MNTALNTAQQRTSAALGRTEVSSTHLAGTSGLELAVRRESDVVDAVTPGHNSVNSVGCVTGPEHQPGGSRCIGAAVHDR